MNTLIEELGVAGQRITQLGAAEGAAGNLSIFVRGEIEPAPPVRSHGVITLPTVVPALAGGWIIVTASGRRLCDIARMPGGALCVLRIEAGGAQALLYAADHVRPTSELNTHIAAHNDQVARHGVSSHAVAHAQPLRLTYLSHRAEYSATRTFSRRLLRWQPETIMEFPEGIATLGFHMPGSEEQMAATVAALREQRAVVWQKHGIVTRAPSIGKAVDLIEYAEAAAQYEYLNLCAPSPAPGLSDEELRSIAQQVGITQTLF